MIKNIFFSCLLFLTVTHSYAEPSKKLNTEEKWEAILQDDSIPAAERLHLAGSAVVQTRKEVKELRKKLVRLESKRRESGEVVCTIDDQFIGKANTETEARAIAVKECVENNSFIIFRKCRETVHCEKEVRETTHHEDQIVPEEKTETITEGEE